MRPSCSKALAEAWDGDWYRRAYFDDGTPLGSVANTECRIDSIAQSWSVISGAGELHCSARAMAAVEKYLVRRDDGLVLLFTPPFDKASPNPGYIKGYPPGIRENGGQYTHAALWTVLAFAMMGDGDKAYDVLSFSIRYITPAIARDSSLPCRTLCCLRGYLQCAAACRARRLDMVHGFGRLDVSRGGGIRAGIAAGGQQFGRRSVHSALLAAVRCASAARRQPLRDHGRESEPCRTRRAGADLDGKRSTDAPRASLWSTMARRIGCA
jgi:hypothetical protein